MPDLVDAVPSFNAFRSAPITVVGSDFVPRAGDYECRFQTDFVICSLFSKTPATFCDEPEIRTSKARVASRSMLICDSPVWDLPAMQLSFEVRKAGVPLLKDDFFSLVSSYAFINSTIPSVAGASGTYNGRQRTVTLVGAGFDAYPSFTRTCSLCYPSAQVPLYTCLFVGLQEKIETRMLEVTSINRVVCEMPTWRHAQSFVDVYLLHEQQPIRSQAVLNFINEWESVDKTELSVHGGEVVRITGHGFSKLEQYKCEYSAAQYALLQDASYVNRTLLTCLSPEWTVDFPAATVRILAGSTGEYLSVNSDVSFVLGFSAEVTELSPTQGPATGGVPITITGRGLFSANEFLIKFECGDVVQTIVLHGKTPSDAQHVVFSSPEWMGEECKSTISIYMSGKEVLYKLNGSKPEFAFLPSSIRMANTTGPLQGGSFLSVIGRAYPVDGSFQFVFAGISSSVHAAVADATCTCQSSCRAYRCLQGTRISPHLISVQIPLWPGVGIANVSMIIANKQPSSSAFIFANFDYSDDFWEFPSTTFGPAGGSFLITVFGQFLVNQQYTLRMIGDEDVVQSSSVSVLSDRVVFDVVDVNGKQRIVSLSVVRDGKEIGLKNKREQQFSFRAVVFDQSISVFAHQTKLTIRGRGLNTSATSRYVCRHVSVNLLSSATCETTSNVTVISDNLMECELPHSDVCPFCQENLTVCYANNPTTCLLTNSSLRAQVLTIDRVGIVESVTPSVTYVKDYELITITGTNLIFGPPFCDVEIYCDFVSDQLVRSLTWNVSESTDWMNVDAHFSSSPAPSWLIINDEIVFLSNQLHVAGNISSYGGDWICTFDLLQSSFNRAEIAIEIFADGVSVAFQLIEKAVAVDTDTELGYCGSNITFVSPLNLDGVSTSSLNFTINAIQASRGQWNTVARNHVRGERVSAVNVTSSVQLENEKIRCDAFWWDLGQTGRLRLHNSHGNFFEGAAEIIFSKSKFVDVSTSRGSARGGDNLLIDGESFCYSDASCTANHYVCRFQTISHVQEVVAVVISNSRISCTTNTWLSEAGETQLTVHDVDQNNLQIKGAAVYEFLEDISSIVFSTSQTSWFSSTLELHGAGFSPLSVSCVLQAKSITGQTLSFYSLSSSYRTSSLLLCLFDTISVDIFAQDLAVSLSRSSQSLGCCGVSSTCSCLSTVQLTEAWFEVAMNTTSDPACNQNGELTTTGNCAALVTVTGARFDVFSRYSCSLLLQDGSNISSSFEQPTSPSTIYFKVDIANNAATVDDLILRKEDLSSHIPGFPSSHLSSQFQLECPS